jgi:multidrug resistance efflux pump
MMSRTSNRSAGLFAPTLTRPGAERARSGGLADIAKPAFPWRRAAKYGVGAMLLAVGALTAYQNLVIRTSREAVINGRITTIRAPMDGVLTTTGTAPGSVLRAEGHVGQIADPLPDDARVFALKQESGAAERERGVMLRRLADLERARVEADAQAEAYRLGRVRQDELRVEEAQSALAAAMAREADADAPVRRGTALHLGGFQSDAAYERLRHAQEIAHHEAAVARKRLDAFRVELEAARAGTYLGDNYNDVPSSFQRARELAVRIDETRALLDQLASKAETVAAQLAAEQKRLTARSVALLTAPISGHLWAVHAASGEYVRKGQDLFSALDCSTVVVTASVPERDYNELQVSDPVRFRVAGTSREYSGTISKLGLTSTGGSFAISPEEHRYQLAISIPGLEASADDSCAVGRTGEVIFEGRGKAFAARVVEILRRSLGLS